MKKRITLLDFQQAALLLNVTVGKVRAVTAVESNGKGFLDDGRVVIRFEPHIFSRYTKGKYDKSHPHLSFPKRKKGYPRNVEHSYQLFNEACTLNANCAVLATSWGLFQIMGFNYSAAGAKNLNDFVAKMEASEGEQLNAFCKLIQNWGLDDELRKGDFRTFARVYNGPDFEENEYDTRMAIEAARYGG